MCRCNAAAALSRLVSWELYNLGPHHATICPLWRTKFLPPLWLFHPLPPIRVCVFYFFSQSTQTVSLLLILTVMPAKLPLPPDTWFRSGESPSTDLLLQNPLLHHNVSFLSVNREHRLGSDFLHPNITFHSCLLIFSPSLSFTSSPGSLRLGLLLIWSSVCFWIPHLISCQQSVCGVFAHIQL